MKQLRRLFLISIVVVVVVVVVCGGCTMRPIEMTDVEMKLDSFKLDGIWSGTIRVPWLGGDVVAVINAEDSGIAETQFECVRTACRLPENTLQKTKRFLFDHYKSEIYGSITAYENGKEIDFRKFTPDVSTQEELWDLLSEISLGFPPEHRIEDDCFFELRAECPWDAEHGLAILFNRKGEPIEIGGQGDHF